VATFLSSKFFLSPLTDPTLDVALESPPADSVSRLLHLKYVSKLKEEEEAEEVSFVSLEGFILVLINYSQEKKTKPASKQERFTTLSFSLSLSVDLQCVFVFLIFTSNVTLFESPPPHLIKNLILNYTLESFLMLVFFFICVLLGSYMGFTPIKHKIFEIIPYKNCNREKNCRGKIISLIKCHFYAMQVHQKRTSKSKNNNK